MKRGVFVGSFNPLTNAHVDICHYLFSNHLLDEIILVPCNSFSKKDILLPISLRYEMIFNYIKKYSYLCVSDIEIKNGSSNFSYNDLFLLQKNFDEPLYIILGADNLQNLDKWDNYTYLLKNYYFIVLNRFSLSVMDIINDKYMKYKNKFIIIDYTSFCSSTIVREKIKNKISFNDDVPKEVSDYITINNLYNNL